jgi:hypothetical protein
LCGNDHAERKYKTNKRQSNPKASDAISQQTPLSE